ncbi:MAG TPA: murein L,D-transpeptidase catalytic domain family protein [Sphingomicrobium sp.]|nr:murein L,D-transpeptidase catalytic domain family protein [Sphingomicrobium sp.]
MLSSAVSSASLPAIVYNTPPVPRDPLAPLLPPAPAAPAGINPILFQKAKSALEAHRYQVRARDVIGIVDFSQSSREERFHLVDLMNGRVESFRVAHGQGSDPAHSGFLTRFSNEFGSYATSNGTYVTGDYYHGKYGLSMKTHGLDWTNSNAEARAIVIHNAWYAEPEVIAQHGKLGRSQGCFAFSREDQYPIMKRLAGGRMIYADKVA